MRKAFVIGSVSLSMISCTWSLRGQTADACPQTMRLCTDRCQNLTWAGDHYDGYGDGQTEIGTRYWVKNWANGHITLEGITAKPIDGIHTAEGIFTGTIAPDGTTIVGGVMAWKVGGASGEAPFTLSWGKASSQETGTGIAASASSATSAGRAAALQAADAWLRTLDSGDRNAAVAGLADEIKTQLQGLTGLQYTVSSSVPLGVPGRDAINHYPNYRITRTLLPDSVKQAQACPCGLPHGNFYVMSYDYRSTWDGKVLVDPRTHQFRSGGNQGTDVLYMLQEHDGTWKPAWIVSISKN